MEGCSLQSPTLVSSLSRNGLIEKPSGVSQFLKFSTQRKYNYNLLATRLRFTHFKAGTLKVRAEAAGVTKKEDSKDADLVFVAGATGRVGSRTVRELLKLGFQVKAGVRNTQTSGSLVQSVKQMKLDDGIQPVEKLELVECDLEKPDRILPALGNASVVVCSIGASEKEVFDITGPYRIDYQATKNLINAATAAKVNHFILVTSLGTNKVGFPAALLNLFWGVLVWKRKAEEALIASGLPYTIVRPGGMERPTDTFKETHNLTLSPEDTLFGGLVSNLQVAELIACMAKNRSLSYCKVVEAVAETTAPLIPMEELLAKIPSQRAEPKEPSVVDKPDVASSKSIIPEKPSASIKEEPVPVAKELPPPPPEKPKAMQSLSPYAAYEDLKPPTSPSPNAPSTAAAANAKPAVSQSASSETSSSSPQSPFTAYDGLKPPTSPSPNAPSTSAAAKPAVSQSASSETSSSSPQSPFTAYDGLKPPTSPSPTPSTSKNNIPIVDGVPKPSISDTQASLTETVSAIEEPPKTRPLSPYFAYEDLKPPSSPSPTPSGSRKAAPSASEGPVSAITGGNDVAKPPVPSVVEEVHSGNSTFYHSPFYMYEDLKPPTSPTPKQS